MHRQIVLLVLPWIVALCGTSYATAQKNNRNQQDEKRENQRVADAQKDVKTHQDSVKKAEQKLRSMTQASARLGAAVANANVHLRQTRERTADQMANRLGIEDALKRVSESKAQLAAYSKPVLDELHKSNDWIAAKKAADEAIVAIDKLHDELELLDDERMAKVRELTPRVLRPAELDRQAVVQTDEGKRLTALVNEALASVQKIRREIPDEKVEADPAVVQARKDLEKAELERKKHFLSLAAERATMQKMQQQLLQAQQKLQQAQAADARDKNRK